MNNKYIFLFVLFFCVNSFSQKGEVNKGEIIKDREFLLNKNELTSIDDEGNFISIRPNIGYDLTHNYFVEFFDNLNFTKRIEIETQNETKILDVFILNKKVHVFTKEKVDKTISLRLDIIDIESKTKSQKILYEIDNESSPEIYDSLENDSNFSIEHSSQIILTLPIVKDKIKYTFVKIFSVTLQELYQHEIYPEKTISYKNTFFLNTSQYNNGVYLLFNLIFDENQKIYRIIELKNGNEKVLDISINNDIYELINSKVENSRLIISGLYSKKKKGGFEGFTYYNIDLESFTVSVQKQNMFFNEKAKAYFNGLFKNNRSIDIENIIIDKEQNTFIIGQFYMIRKQYIPIGIPIANIGSSFYITYNPINIEYKLFDDLLVAKISANGELSWDRILELQQTEKIESNSNKRDSSISSFLLNNGVSIFLNGFIDIEKDKVIVKQDKPLSKTNFYNVNFTSQGNIIPEIIFSNKDSQILFRACKTVNSNDFYYILGQGNMRKQLINFKL